MYFTKYTSVHDPEVKVKDFEFHIKILCYKFLKI